MSRRSVFRNQQHSCFIAGGMLRVVALTWGSANLMKIGYFPAWLKRVPSNISMRHGVVCAGSISNSANGNQGSGVPHGDWETQNDQGNPPTDARYSPSSDLPSSPPPSPTPAPGQAATDLRTAFGVYEYTESRGTVVCEHSDNTPVIQVKWGSRSLIPCIVPVLRNCQHICMQFRQDGQGGLD